MHRLFVAIRPPAPVREGLLAMMSGVDGARWQDDGLLHITLRFVGEVDGRMGEEVSAALARIDVPPLELTLSGVGTFSKKGRVHTLWAGAGPRVGLELLNRKIDRAAVSLGLPSEDRAYHPHITLARFGARGGDLGNFLSANGGYASAPFTATEFGLYESRTDREGTVYELIESYALGAKGRIAR